MKRQLQFAVFLFEDLRVLSWARTLKPSIPADIRDRVRWYFGEEIKRDG